MYSAYGVRLISDHSISGLVPIHNTIPQASDLCVRLSAAGSNGEQDLAGETLWYTSELTGENGNPLLKIWKGCGSGDIFVRYSHGLTFRVDTMLAQIDVYCGQQTSGEDASLYLLGPILGLVLRLRGRTCLHASAVEIDGRAVAFAGEMGAGKSTTAAIFAQNGHAVLTDDIVALENRNSCLSVLPGYPYLNLLPDSMSLFSDAVCVSPAVETEKLKLTLDGKRQRFQNEALPLGIIYVLAPRLKENSQGAMESLCLRDALVALASNTYANKVLDESMRASEFCALAEVVISVPVRKLVLPAQSFGMRTLYQAILDDATSVMKSRAA